MAVPNYAFRADAPWTPWGSGFTRIADDQFSVADGAFAQQVFTPGRVLHGYDTGVDASIYWQVTAAVPAAGVLTVTVRGVPFVATVVSLGWSWQSGGRLIERQFVIHGRFADAADNTLLISDILLKNERWHYTRAVIIGFDLDVLAGDSGATQPRINIRVDGVDICTANAGAGIEVNQATTVQTGVNIDVTAYAIPYGGLLELATDANGANNDASDLSVRVFCVVEE